MLVLERSTFFVQVALLKSPDHPRPQPSCRGQEAVCGILFLAGCRCFALLLNEVPRLAFPHSRSELCVLVSDFQLLSGPL